MTESARPDGRAAQGDWLRLSDDYIRSRRWGGSSIYGMQFLYEHPDGRRRWAYVFDIDFVAEVEAPSESGGWFHFQVSPATLLFEHVVRVDLRIDRGAPADPCELIMTNFSVAHAPDDPSLALFVIEGDGFTLQIDAAWAALQQRQPPQRSSTMGLGESRRGPGPDPFPPEVR